MLIPICSLENFLPGIGVPTTSPEKEPSRDFTDAGVGADAGVEAPFAAEGAADGVDELCGCVEAHAAHKIATAAERMSFVLTICK